MQSLRASTSAGSHTLQRAGQPWHHALHRSIVSHRQQADVQHACIATAAAAAAASARAVSTRASGQGTASTSSTAGRPSAQEQDDFAVDQRPIILFDGVCNMCNAGVNLVLDRDTQRQFRFAALQSPAGRRLLRRSGRSPEDLSSIVLVERDRCSIKSQAFLRIGEKLGGPFPMLAALGGPLPGPLRDLAYDQLAANRYSVAGKRTECRLTDDRGFAARFIQD